MQPANRHRRVRFKAGLGLDRSVAHRSGLLNCLAGNILFKMKLRLVIENDSESKLPLRGIAVVQPERFVLNKARRLLTFIHN